MRIETTDRDYYDAVQGSGGHSDLVWRRQPREGAYPVPGQAPLPNIQSGEGWRTYPYLGTPDRYRAVRNEMGQRHYVLGFCGKIWPMVRFHDHDAGHDRTYTHCYAIDQVTEYLEGHGGWRALCHQGIMKSERRRNRQTTHSQRIMSDWFDRCYAAQGRHAELFLEGRSPSFSVMFRSPGSRKRPTIVWDQVLGQYDFARVLDPYAAFQEAAMFMGGLAAPEKPIPQMSDVDMASIKGFDERSFRNPHRY